MFGSVLKSIRSSKSKTDPDSLHIDENQSRKRQIIDEDQASEATDVLQTPPNKRPKNTGGSSSSFFNSWLASAMNFSEKYNQARLWSYVVGKLKKENPRTIVTIDLESEDNKRNETKSSSADKDVVFVGSKSRDVIICEDKPRSRYAEPSQIKRENQPELSRSTSLGDSIRARKPLQVNRMQKESSYSYIHTSTPLRQPDDQAKTNLPGFKIPDVPSLPQGNWKGKNYNARNYEEIKEKRQGSVPVYHRAPEAPKPSTHLQNSSLLTGNKSFESNFNVSQQPAISKHQGKIKVRRPKVSPRKTVYQKQSRQRSTASDVIRLEERARYQQLLLQFTSNIPHSSLSVNEPASNKENSVLNNISSHSSIRNTGIFATKPPKLHRRPIRSMEASILSPRLSLLPSRQAAHQSTPLSPRSHPTILKVMPSTTKAHSISEHIEDLTLYSKPDSVGLLNKSTISTRTLQPQTKHDDLLSGNWTKKWRDILSPENLHRERELAKIEREEERLCLLKAKRKEQEELAIEEIKERILIEEQSEEEEEDEEDFITLTEEMEREVDRALGPGNPSETLADGFKISISRGDMATLSNLNWLNDEIINIYFSLIAERSKCQAYPKVHTFNSFFYPKLIKSGYTSLKRWTRKVDIFAMDMIIVPIHLGMHWCLAVIDFRNKTIKYFDSLKGSNNHCLDALQKYLLQESKDKKKVPFDTTGWTLSCPKDIPEQLNGCDCGVFACKYAEFITRDAKFAFNQHNMPYFRRRMVYEILKTKLL